jgi:hypothetical protein
MEYDVVITKGLALFAPLPRSDRAPGKHVKQIFTQFAKDRNERRQTFSCYDRLAT